MRAFLRGAVLGLVLAEAYRRRPVRTRIVNGFPRYDQRRRCPKCGGVATVSFDTGLGFDFIRNNSPPWGQVLDRKCSCCGHGWMERPLDAWEATDAEKREWTERSRA